VLLFVSLLACPAQAYVDWAPTLGKTIKDSTNIVVLKVDKVSEEKRAIIFTKVADLKGTFAAERVNHQITDGLHPREPYTIMDWAEPGQTAIFFRNGPNFVMCIGRYWYQGCAVDGPWWRMTSGRPELALAYYGSVDKLREHVTAMLAGKEVVLTAIRFGKVGHGGSREMRTAVVYRNTLRGGAENPLWRLKASLKMPDFAYQFIDDSKVQLGPASDPQEVPALIKRLQGDDVAARIEAARDLADLGVIAKAAAPALTVALTDKSASLRRVAAGALGDVAGEAAIPALTKALRDTDAKVRWQAADALGRIGPKARSAVEPLMAALKDKDSSMRGIAADALGGIGEGYARAAVPALQQALKDPESNVRLTAAAALVRIDCTAAKATLPLFFEELKKTDDTRIRLNYLSYIQRASVCEYWQKDWIPTLIDIVRTDEFWVDRCSAVGLLLAMTRADAAFADQALPPILEALKTDPDPNLFVRYGIPGGLADPKVFKHAGRHKAAVIQGLTESLRHKDPGMRIVAARALGAIGADAKAAVNDLNVLLNDSHPEARSSAVTALKSIQQD
jgi:HEAT repeat protein